MDVALLANLVERQARCHVGARRRRPRGAASTGRASPRDQGFPEIYNRALDGTWGFTLLQEGEVTHIATGWGIIAPGSRTRGGGKAGAVLALLDYNQIIRKLNGRLFPSAYSDSWGASGSTRWAIAVMMVPGYQQSGFAIVLLDRLSGGCRGVSRLGVSWFSR
jgi:hypothetical protein